jgi:ATP/ADP translocase
MVSSSLSRRCGLVVVAIVTVVVISVAVSVAFVVAVVIDRRSLSPLSSPLSSSPVSVVAAQQWRRSNGQRRWLRSDVNGGAATVMG